MLYICFSLYYLYLVCHRAPTHGGLGCRGAAPASIKHKTYFVHRARRAGRRSRRARRAQASAGSASRAEPGKGETRCRRHALKRWFGSGEVSPDGVQGAQPPAMSALRVYIKNQSKRCIACSAMKRKNNFDTKCTPLVLFVKRFEESLKGAHPKSQYA